MTETPRVVVANPEFGWFSIDETIWLAWQGEPYESNLYEVHRPVGTDKRHGLGWIDVMSGDRHRIVEREPLHIEASIGCAQGCGFHGFIRNGHWVPA